MRTAAFMKLAMMVAVVNLAASAQAKDVVIPFHRDPAHRVLLVQAKINGTTGILLFDTGATRSLIAAERVGVPAAKLPPSVRRTGPGIRTSGLARRIDLRLGTRSFCDIPVVAVDLGDFRSVYGDEVWGILGQDLMSEFSSVMIDYRRNEIVLSD